MAAFTSRSPERGQRLVVHTASTPSPSLDALRLLGLVGTGQPRPGRLTGPNAAGVAYQHRER